MKKHLVVLLLLTSCSEEKTSSNCDYIIQYDAPFNKYYIYSCEKYGKQLRIGYSSFYTEEDAINKVKQIRENDKDPNKRTRFIDVP